MYTHHVCVTCLHVVVSLLSVRTFPWVLKVFGISAYHFYKLIEVAIKLERDFPRGIIKHLNRVSFVG